ncbi:MAG: GGDEF domain-containing response regulator, partial [Longimicrobiales bacterium]
GMEGVDLDVEQVTTLDGALERLTRGGIDVVLLDLFLPDSEGLTTFERASAFAPDVPFIIVTDVADDQLAVSTVQGGAQDYLVRSEIRPSMLGRAILYAIERHRLLSALRSLSLIDDLTGLYNRRGFTELGEQYMKLAWRSGRAITLVYLDIDRFKSINDTLGHLVGDRALRRVADILRATFRRSDIVARLGGDEFAVLALETTGEPAEWLAQRLREGVSMHNASSREPFRLAASVGVARSMGEQQVDLEDLLAQADAAMYREKRSKKKAAYL